MLLFPIISSTLLWCGKGLQSRSSWACAEEWVQWVGQPGWLQGGWLWDPSQVGSRMTAVVEQTPCWNQGTAAPSAPAWRCLAPRKHFSLSPALLHALPEAPPTLSCCDLTAGFAQVNQTTPDSCCCQEGKFRMLKSCCSPCAWHQFSSACCWPLVLVSIWYTLYMRFNGDRSCWKVQGEAESSHVWIKQLELVLVGKLLYMAKRGKTCDIYGGAWMCGFSQIPSHVICLW